MEVSSATGVYPKNFAPHPTQKPWDLVFSNRLTYWVTITLKNGEIISGMYGPNSFASSAPAEEQIYLEEYWLLNDKSGFDRPVDQTAGILILSSEIVSVELMQCTLACARIRRVLSIRRAGSVGFKKAKTKYFYVIKMTNPPVFK